MIGGLNDEVRTDNTKCEDITRRYELEERNENG